MHEGTHYRLLKNKLANDFVTEIFLSWPLFISMFNYRDNHLKHHSYLNTDLDPDFTRKLNSKNGYEWDFPMTILKLMKILLKDLLAINVLQALKNIMRFSLKKKENFNIKYTKIYFILPWLRFLFYISFFIVIIYFHLWSIFFIYWIIPLLTWLKMILRIRSIAEHFAIPNKSDSEKTRTTYPSILERIFISSYNIWYHTEHHLFPSIPYYNLPKLHKLITRQEKNDVYVTKTYFRVLKEIIN